MNWLRQLWHKWTTSTEVALLRAENERLLETNAVLEDELAQMRAEVRSLVNSALSQAGVAPLPPVSEQAPKPINRLRHMTEQQRRRFTETARERILRAEAEELKKRVAAKG